MELVGRKLLIDVSTAGATEPVWDDTKAPTFLQFSSHTCNMLVIVEYQDGSIGFIPPHRVRFNKNRPI